MTKQSHYCAIESIRADGSKAYHFIEGTSAESRRYANQLADRFERSATVVATRTFIASADTVERLRQQARATLGTFRDADTGESVNVTAGPDGLLQGHTD